MVFRKRGKKMEKVDNKVNQYINEKNDLPTFHYYQNKDYLTKLLKEAYELLYDLENKKQDLEKVLWYLKREIKNGNR